MLVLPCNDLPEGNQSGSINKNSEQSDDSNTLSKLGEVRHIHFENKVLQAVLSYLSHSTYIVFRIKDISIAN